MSSPQYRFVTHWRIPNASIEEVATILEDVEQLSAWWPTVYLSVKMLEPGGPGGVGKDVELLTKGWLPYKLRWSFVVSESNSPHGFTIQARGDFGGTGKWKLVQDASDATVEYDWQITVPKPLIRRLTWLLRPIFSWNHRWAMDQGEKSLRAEVARRRIARLRASARTESLAGSR